MLNAGFSTLDYLKSRILPEAAWEETTYDAALSRLGLAVAKRFNNYCNRFFEREEIARDRFGAACLSVVLTHYPVEVINGMFLVTAGGSGQAVEPDAYVLDATSGVIEFLSVPGTQYETLDIEYTGGFWLPVASDEDISGQTFPLPDDILEAWISEIQLQAEARSIFEAVGLRAAKDADKARKNSGLTEDTIQTLNPYRRFAGA